MLCNQSDLRVSRVKQTFQPRPASLFLPILLNLMYLVDTILRFLYTRNRVSLLLTLLIDIHVNCSCLTTVMVEDYTVCTDDTKEQGGIFKYQTVF